MTGDVFKEAPFGSCLADNAGDLGPEVAGIIGTEPVACKRERLARITGSDEMNPAAPRLATEGSQIVPDRSRSQGRVCHPCHESGRGERVSLDMTHSSISGFGQMQAEVKSADAGAKADAAKLAKSLGGTKSHKRFPFRRSRSCRGWGSGMASGKLGSAQGWSGPEISSSERDWRASPSLAMV